MTTPPPDSESGEYYSPIPRAARVAVVGLGKMGIMHSAMASMAPRCALAAICDRKRQLGVHVKSMGVAAPFYESFSAMLAAEKPAGVIISAPQAAHADLAVEALRFGAGVLVEKPLAHTLEAARRIRDEAEAFPHLATGVAFMLAQHPVFNEARRLVAEGAIGRPHRYDARMRLSQVFAPRKGWIYTKALSGGGVLINSGSHLLFLVQRLFGLPESVSALMRSHHSREVEDDVRIQAAHADGLTGEIECHWSLRGFPAQVHEMTIEGDAGRIELTDRHIVLETGEQRRVVTEGELVRSPFTLTPHYYGHAYYEQVADFAAVLNGKRERCAVPVSEGYDVQRFLEAVYRAAETNTHVDLSTIV
ncbi:MAG: Gfo/Idh/MocA family oxidoreductase [Candidatus Sumerlaeia bacterium]|nr:Gfo/Idh/MocA family oxidoreductase [Candidatus Sumerlaeia bacterium]